MEKQENQCGWHNFPKPRHSLAGNYFGSSKMSEGTKLIKLCCRRFLFSLFGNPKTTSVLVNLRMSSQSNESETIAEKREIFFQKNDFLIKILRYFIRIALLYHSCDNVRQRVVEQLRLAVRWKKKRKYESHIKLYAVVQDACLSDRARCFAKVRSLPPPPPPSFPFVLSLSLVNLMT